VCDLQCPCRSEGPGAVAWALDLFTGVCGAVLRKGDLDRILTNRRTADPINELAGWHVRFQLASYGIA